MAIRDEADGYKERSRRPYGTEAMATRDEADGQSEVRVCAPPRWLLSMRRSRGGRLLLGSVRGTSIIAVFVVAMSHVAPRRTGG